MWRAKVPASMTEFSHRPISTPYLHAKPTISKRGASHHHEASVVRHGDERQRYRQLAQRLQQVSVPAEQMRVYTSPQSPIKSPYPGWTSSQLSSGYPVPPGVFPVCPLIYGHWTNDVDSPIGTTGDASHCGSATAFPSVYRSAQVVGISCRLTSGSQNKAAKAVMPGKMAVTIEGRRYGNVSKTVPSKRCGIVLAGSASPPPIIGPYRQHAIPSQYDTHQEPHRAPSRESTTPVPCQHGPNRRSRIVRSGRGLPQPPEFRLNVSFDQVRLWQGKLTDTSGENSLEESTGETDGDAG